ALGCHLPTSTPNTHTQPQEAVRAYIRAQVAGAGVPSQAELERRCREWRERQPSVQLQFRGRAHDSTSAPLRRFLACAEVLRRPIDLVLLLTSADLSPPSPAAAAVAYSSA